MLANDLAEAIADLGATVVSVSRLRWNFAYLPSIWRRRPRRADLLDRTNSNSKRFSQRTVRSASFGHTHFRTVHERRNVGRIGISIANETSAVV